MEVTEIGWEGVEWIDVSQDKETVGWAVLNTVPSLRVPYNEGYFLTR